MIFTTYSFIKFFAPYPFGGSYYVSKKHSFIIVLLLV